MKWTSKYGSLVTTLYGLGTADGTNEHGLTLHMLYLNAADFGPRDPSLPGIHAGLWAQFALDNAVSVDEDPAYDQQLQLLKALDFSNPSSDTPLPGNVNPRDRFQRAPYFLAIFPQPKTQREGVAGVFALARNISVPFGAPYKSFGIYNTEYRTVTDATNKRYFFELTTSPSVIWTDMSKLDFSVGTPVRMLNPENLALSGEMSADYTNAAAPF